ncbi:MAG TPA: hypothetical protein VK773_11695 [Acidimicrobiales bacterium]|jgi:hypothetical protein|nr:hypothetical protein [Acidimicrobiales bacterium]
MTKRHGKETERMRRTRRWLPVLALPALVGAIAMGPLAASGGADTVLLGYNASASAIGAQFAFNVPGVVPLPNENLIEDDVPFARVTLGGGPVVDSIGAPYYPGDIAANLGTLLQTFGAPALPLNDPLLAESKYPTSPGYPASVTFPQGTKPGALPVAQGTATASTGGGTASGTVTDLSLANLLNLSKLPVIGGVLSSTSGSVIDVGNISATNNIVVGNSSISSTATSNLGTIDIAGLVDIAGLTATAVATSDGTTGTPTATVHLGDVTVDGTAAYIDDTGVHVAKNSSPPVGVTPAQLQQTVDSTLGQDGVNIRLADPQQTSSGAQASANSGGLVISLTHQFAVPFIPGEPTIPIPELGNVGLPAGDYTMTTAITFGLAQASVDASAPGPSTGTTGNTGAAAATSPSTSGTAGTTGVTGNTGLGSIGSQGLVQSLEAPTGSTGTGSGAAAPAPGPTSATAFPIGGIPPPVGWTVTALLACVLLAYPLLLLARWQFAAAGRRRP